jgi:hypothetical protein
MRRLTALCAATALLLGGISLRAQSDSEVTAHRVALELAGAFSNDGFKIRDGHWVGAVKQGGQAVIAVNLYAGNQYWFSVGADKALPKLAVQVFDENGKLMESEPFAAEDKAAAGFSPEVSGQYFVSIAAIEGAADAFCLVYSYK